MIKRFYEIGELLRPGKVIVLYGSGQDDFGGKFFRVDRFEVSL